MENINRYIDHTQLQPDAKQEAIDQLLKEAKDYNFFSVCLNPTWVKYAAEALADTEVNVCTVIGFPLGATTPAAKAFETKDAVANGADEVDMVINIGRLKSGQYDAVLEDIKAVVDAAGDALVKVIIETCLLSNDEIVKACELSQEAGADFVKTSTGFSTAGAKAEDVKLMKDTVGDAMEVKASGGIHTRDEAMAMIEAGASRLGMSKGMDII
ncbi:deoxyribose-phosphate aldolase [Aerococcus suis]|uniref:Deoxyribose-phosphate aldolase n=1 Tax=Aerococcus suis TaxID=371602 RepID=A0A1W1Y478_9LACT|nr:deoxyribose-phosphate aldolase [Aerococcus suis]MCI7240079.1 deoxyribose-phosphate aldolase [Aerococcus suis]MDD7758056.1 deoxyribose-phosphate aldolase [Aerococcus suis]SMC30966.1 deoxyribose-phosphate aldolase [Aerococcus suis]